MSNFSLVHDLPQALRSSYLESLPEPQEWFLEELVRSGEVWEVPDQGYAVFSGDALVEFHTIGGSDWRHQLSKLIRKRPFRKVLCKSFDHDLINASKILGWVMDETGFLFRKRNRVVLDKIHNFRLDRAKPSDLSDAWDIGRDFYDGPDEVEHIFQSAGLWIAFHDGQMVGNGITIPVDGACQVFDIGMVTRQSHRSKGFGSQIVVELAEMLERDGKRPICGCAKSNVASKAALEKAGFVSEHRLVEIDIPT